jgi:NUDIX domain.
MAGAWVYPGGAVDAADRRAGDVVVSDDPALLPWRAALARELVEETGIWVTTGGTHVVPLAEGERAFIRARRDGIVFDGDRFVYFARWVTPAPLPVRFDARFFLCEVDATMEPVIDGRELVAAEWVAPSDALRRAEAGRWRLALPTRRTLAYLDRFVSTAEAMADARRQRPVAVQPRLRIVDGAVGFVLPGEEGFAEAEAGERDPSFVQRLAALVGGSDELRRL